MKYFFRMIINSMIIVILAYILPSIFIDGFVTALKVALILSLLNTFIKPIFIILTFPITILTLGLFLLIINTIMVLITDHFIDGFKISSFLGALFFSIVLSIIQGLVHKTIE